MADKPPRGRAPVKKCPTCQKKMAAFWQNGKWVHRCAKEAQHAADKLKLQQLTGSRNKGGVKRGTPSPMKGRERNKKYVTRYDRGKLRRKPKDE